MSIYIIPVQNRTDANSLTVELSGDFFQLKFTFNANESMWYMSIVKNNVEIASAVKLVSTDDLLAQFRAYDIPEGRMFVEDKDGLFSDPDETNFGESVFLKYDDLL